MYRENLLYAQYTYMRKFKEKSVMRCRKVKQKVHRPFCKSELRKQRGCTSFIGFKIKLLNSVSQFC